MPPSPYSDSVVATPTKDNGVSIRINYNNLNAISSFPQLPIPLVHEFLSLLGKGHISSLFDLA